MSVHVRGEKESPVEQEAQEKLWQAIKRVRPTVRGNKRKENRGGPRPVGKEACKGLPGGRACLSSGTKKLEKWVEWRDQKL